MKFDIKKKLVAKSGRVKSVDIHPQFPWVLIGLYSGNINIYDYNSQACLQYIEVTQVPIRCARFIPEKSSFICGSDDKKIRIYNYNTMEKTKELEVHTDFIRSIIVHPKEPYILTCSDDGTILLWDMDKGFTLIRTYEEHKNFVMKIAINPKDINMFASGSMDLRVKIWSFSSNNSHLTLEGHTKGVNTVSFCPLNEKPYLASGADDRSVRIWDYTTKHCVYILEGHEENVSALLFHPELPILISGAEDTSCKFWNLNTFKLEDSKNFGLETIWDVSVNKESNIVSLGCEEGTIVMRMGSDQPLAIFNLQTAKVIFCKQNAIFSFNLKVLQGDLKDGEPIELQPKNLGNTDLFPTSLKYSPNGRHFSVQSDREFVVSTSGVYRSSCVGNCSDLAWHDSGDFAIKDGSSIKIFKNLTESSSFKPGYSFDVIFGGPFLSIKTGESVQIYDFETQVFIRKIDVSPNNIFWNEKSQKLAIVCEEVTYILKVFPEKIHAYVDKISDGGKQEEDGCEEAFELSLEITDRVVSGIWLEEIFIFINSKNKINYSIENQIFPITALNKNFYLLGYLPNLNRFFLINKNHQLISYMFPLSFVNYQIAILKEEFDKAEGIYSQIPKEYNEKVTKFLEKFGNLEISYKISTVPAHKFSLAVKLKKLDEAYNFVFENPSQEKWKMVADLALDKGEFTIAEEAMKKANDYNGLLLFYSSISNRESLEKLADKAEADGYFNVAFSCYFQLNDLNKCLDILIKSNKIPEASLFCRTYCPSKLEEVLGLWNNQINQQDSSNRTNIRVINPLESYENSSQVTEIESYVNKFYEKTKTSSVDDHKMLSAFNDVDLEAVLNENGNLDIDLEELLKI